MNIFFLFVGFIVSLLAVLFALKYIMGALDYLPWFSYLFTIFIMMVPSVLFITVFIIYLKRTQFYPSPVVKWISIILFSIALLFWVYFLIIDVIYFFKTGAREVGKYNSYNVIYLSTSVAMIFLIGVLQALSTEKEKDWLEKRKEREAMESETLPE
ncbi:MAG: hypothetical protein WEA59_09720 [Ferruginibacter sp.]